MSRMKPRLLPPQDSEELMRRVKLFHLKHRESQPEMCLLVHDCLFRLSLRRLFPPTYAELNLLFSALADTIERVYAYDEIAEQLRELLEGHEQDDLFDVFGDDLEDEYSLGGESEERRYLGL